MHNDHPTTQKKRIEALVTRLDPALKIEFYENQVQPETTDIRFRLRSGASGKIVGAIKEDHEWLASEVADLSDQELLQKLRSVLAG